MIDLAGIVASIATTLLAWLSSGSRAAAEQRLADERRFDDIVDVLAHIQSVSLAYWRSAPGPQRQREATHLKTLLRRPPHLLAPLGLLEDRPIAARWTDVRKACTGGCFETAHPPVPAGDRRLLNIDAAIDDFCDALASVRASRRLRGLRLPRRRARN